MPDARLDALRLVRNVPGPKKPVLVVKPNTDTPTPIVTNVPSSVIEELPKVSSSKNLATRFDTPPDAVRIPVTFTDVQATPDPVDIRS